MKRQAIRTYTVSQKGEVSTSAIALPIVMPLRGFGCIFGNIALISGAGCQPFSCMICAASCSGEPNFAISACGSSASSSISV